MIRKTGALTARKSHVTTMTPTLKAIDYIG
jgi:hypothetical protein